MGSSFPRSCPPHLTSRDRSKNYLSGSRSAAEADPKSCRHSGESRNPGATCSGLCRSPLDPGFRRDDGRNRSATMSVTYLDQIRCPPRPAGELPRPSHRRARCHAPRARCSTKRSCIAIPRPEDRFMLYETWESHEDVMAVQLQRPYRRAWHDALPALLRTPPRRHGLATPARRSQFHNPQELRHAGLPNPRRHTPFLQGLGNRAAGRLRAHLCPQLRRLGLSDGVSRPPWLALSRL